MCLREMKAAIVLTVLASVGLAVSEDCPAPSTILPCSCHSGDYLATVTCSNVTDFGSIKKMLAGKFDGSFQLNLTNIEEKTFERGAAEAVSVFSILLIDSPMIESLAKNSLLDMAQLRYVEITNTSLTSIPTAALATLPKLNSFSCEISRITRLLKKDFQGISTTLRSLSLSRNSISSIEEGAFIGFPRLRELYLYACHLKTLPAGHWIPSNINLLILRYNKINAIPMENFSGLKNSYIELDDNEIRQLPNEAEMMKFFDKGNTLDLFFNPLQCTCGLKWIADYEPLHRKDSPLRGRCEGEGLRKGKRLTNLTAADFSDCNSTTL